mmetsp:Transcript_7929/g.10057  ORF Transcript_7929/g.10057 Transcript_7929/m.10057 type:complete len:94 (+) Transcript_7929:136-417(+)
MIVYCPTLILFSQTNSFDDCCSSMMPRSPELRIPPRHYHVPLGQVLSMKNLTSRELHKQHVTSNTTSNAVLDEYGDLLMSGSRTSAYAPESQS